MNWLRRSFITGFFVTVPLFISVAALVWIFHARRRRDPAVVGALLGREVPGLGVLLTVGIILVVGAIATNIIGKRVLQRGGVLPAAGAGVQDDLLAGEAAGRGVFAATTTPASRRS